MKLGPAIIATAIMIATPIIVANVSLPTIPALAQSMSNPIKVKTYTEFVSGIHKLKILSVVDSVEIKSITLNRGNCNLNDVYSDSNGKVYHYNPDIGQKSNQQLESEGWEKSSMGGYRRPGITLKYGETKEFSHSCDQVLEMVIKTNLGDFKFEN